VRCERRDCGGAIIDGYCDLCGMAPSRAGAALPAPPAASAAEPDFGDATISAFTSGRSSTGPRGRSGVRRRLGAGLVEVPAVPYRDPADAVMAEPAVPERRRFCVRCDEPVGRSRDGVPGRTVGFCRKCGAPFSFVPKLRSGELVAGQYEVAGCLAHGGMGWVYLARDRNVSDRWVVLKGLLHADDRDATAAALAERRFLAEVDHPNIVKIFNFVQHESSGYIVMEYVGGQSLKQILAARREAGAGQPEPLPPAQAIAYMLEILPALGYLHDLGLLFCDFKIDNVIQTQHSLELIDLGGVYRMDEPSSAVFGTVGYQAPEVASAGPSVASDLFTVARTLAVLCLDFRGYQSQHRYSLPPQESVPLLAHYDSLYWFLVKGTAPDRDDRFQSAEEMADQLHGVLREVVADQERRPVPAPSTLFTAAWRADPERADWRILPRPQVSSEDPSAGYLATIAATDPQQMLAQLRAAPEQTTEVELRIASVMIDARDLTGATELLRKIETSDRWEWRTHWYRGILELAEGHGERARELFTTVYRWLPGELAPKLALALACESAADAESASQWYEIVSRTDPSITSASFGLARCRLALGDRAGALAAYDRVPESSSGHLDAQAARIRTLSSANGTGEPGFEDLLAAASRLESLPLEREQRDQLSTEVLERVLRLVLAGKVVDGAAGTILGHSVNERDLRAALEASYRTLARHAVTRTERVRLVDEANRTRPRTWK
jgi:serine/threonine-protein kinase PknG